MKSPRKTAFTAFVLAMALSIGLAGITSAQVSRKILESMSVPGTIESSIGTLSFSGGVPAEETASKVFDTVLLSRALEVFNNSFRGASALAMVKGFQSIGAGPNDVVIFSSLMDSSSLFLTANADTVYSLSAIDLSKGPMVIEQPSDALGTINDMWFQ